MIILTIAGLYLFSSLALASEGALVEADINEQLAAANGNLTALKTQIAHGIAAGPAYRGTFDIAWSCLLTILACIYNTMHLNVPRRNTGKWMLFLRKARWAIIALFAPENVVLIATTQILEAHKVKKEVNAMRGQTRGRNKPKLIDLRYGFYITMGGFVFDIKNLRDGLSLVTLTPRGVITIARQGQFVDISTEDITDKSKADIFTKSLVYVQVSWMVIQCIARKAAAYPLTLLEIHTMVHVVCALIIYVLWWKHLWLWDRVSLGGVQKLMFYSSMFRRALINNVKNLAVSGQGTSVADKDERTIQVLGEADSFEDLCHHVGPSKLDQEAISPKPTVCTLHPGQNLPCSIGVRADSLIRYELSSSDVRRWELGASAIVEILKSSPREGYNLADTVKIHDLDLFLTDHGFYGIFKEYITHLVGDMVDRLVEHLWYEHSVRRGTWVLFLALLRFLLPLTAAYGGIHLSAWNFEFPSRIEFIIWRIACFIIMGGPFGFLVARSCVHLGYNIELYISVSEDSDIRSFLIDWGIEEVLELPAFFIKIVSVGFACLLGLCYAAARLYLVVESFISLRHVPIGVYAAVPWVQNIPHV